jgi:hypothetical protein
MIKHIAVIFTAAIVAYQGTSVLGDDQTEDNQVLRGALLPPRDFSPRELASSKCRIFVSSKTYTGGFGGIDEVHEQCQYLARRAELETSGHFKAVLFSDQETRPDYDANDELSGCSGGVYLVKTSGRANTSRKVASSISDLMDPKTRLKYAISYTEKGRKRSGTKYVWTGAKKDGSDFIAADEDCYSDWEKLTGDKKGAYGKATSTRYDWLDDGTTRCKNKLHIYCVEQAGKFEYQPER